MKIPISAAAALMLWPSFAQAHVPNHCLRHNAVIDSFVAAKKSDIREYDDSSKIGIRAQIKEALKGSLTKPNFDENGFDRRRGALTALDGFTYSYIELDTRNFVAWTEYLNCIVGK